MIDTHNHLHQFAEPAATLQQSLAAGIHLQVVNGTSPSDWPKVRDLTAKNPHSLRPCFGLHPWEVPSRPDNWLSTLKEYLITTPHAGLGECGLDRWKQPYHLPTQLTCFEEQLDLALSLDRPVTVHCLKAWGPLLSCLKIRQTIPRLLIHAFSGSTESLSILLDLGAYISFNGYFLHERKKALSELYQTLPIERLLLESDAPSMLPPPEYQTNPLSNEQNHPSNLSLILPALASLRNISPEALTRQLTKNFNEFWQLPPSQ